MSAYAPMEQQNKKNKVATSSIYRYKALSFRAFKPLETVQPLNTIYKTQKVSASLRYSRDTTAPKCNSMVI